MGIVFPEISPESEALQQVDGIALLWSAGRVAGVTLGRLSM